MSLDKHTSRDEGIPWPDSGDLAMLADMVYCQICRDNDQMTVVHKDDAYRVRIGVPPVPKWVCAGCREELESAG